MEANDYHIGVCRKCGRYGQLLKEGRVCAVAEPHGLVTKEHFRRTRACQRISESRLTRKIKPGKLHDEGNPSFPIESQGD